MTDSIPAFIRFPCCNVRVVEAVFSGGAFNSDGGALLLRQADRSLGMTGLKEKIYHLRRPGTADTTVVELDPVGGEENEQE